MFLDLEITKNIHSSDAKVIRRVESPVPAAPPPVVDGKRTPKPKAPKGASPEPATPKSPLPKLKVNLVFSLTT